MRNFSKLNWRSRVVFFCVVVSFVVTGCASYKYELASDPYKGYVVKRNDFLIPEYTVDTHNIAPQDLKVAENRLKRRKAVVSDYYRKMGRIESQLQAMVLDYPLFLLTLITAVVRLPFIMVSDYKYEHNTKYREAIDQRDDALDLKEVQRLEKLQVGLNKFIEDDLKKESAVTEPPPVVQPQLNAVK